MSRWLFDGNLRQVECLWLVSGTLDADFEVKRTIKRAELTAFLRLLRRLVGPTRRSETEVL